MENFVYGRNNIIELLEQNKRSISKIIILNSAFENHKIAKIIELAKKYKVLFQFVPKEKFQKYANISHQGVIAFTSPVEYKNFDDFINKKSDNYRKIIITDGVEDANNMGSIIRSAVCAGFDAVIFPNRRNALINAAVEKASAGAVNRIDLIMVNSLVSIIEKLKNNNFWIIATDIHAKDNYFEIDYSDINFAIVMGSENEGISSSILKQADFKIKIPMPGNFNSLNVANAASVVIFETVKQLMQKTPNRV